MLDKNTISRNFTVAKVLAITMVLTGHFFGGLLCVPTTMSLFVFGFSSGFFTSCKYKNDYSFVSFWKNKIYRLVGPLVVINLFLLVLFIIKGKSGILTWHSIISVLGMNGLLSWFGIHNQSPFGSGLWFFTLLIVFYFVYPFVQRIVNSPGSLFFMCMAIVILSFIHFLAPFEYSLWTTAISFIFGVFICSKGCRLKRRLLVISFLCIVVAILIMNFYLYDTRLNYFLILCCSMSIVLLLVSVKLPCICYEVFLLLSGAVIEIYFIHTYMFVKTGIFPAFVGYCLSLILILLTSLLLAQLAKKITLLLGNTLFAKPFSRTSN